MFSTLFNFWHKFITQIAYFFFRNTWILGNPKIGEGTWIGPFVVLDAEYASLTIGRGCNISAGVKIVTHSTVKRCLFNKKDGILDIEARPVKIEDYVFIGINAVILMGVEIGHHSIIGAGAVVLEDTKIPPYSFVVGVPGKIKNKRTKEVSHE